MDKNDSFIEDMKIAIRMQEIRDNVKFIVKEKYDELIKKYIQLVKEAMEEWGSEDILPTVIQLCGNTAEVYADDPERQMIIHQWMVCAAYEMITNKEEE